MLVFKGTLITHVCVNLESDNSVLSIVSFNLYQPKRRKGTWMSVFMFYAIMQVLLKVVSCLWQPV